MKKIYRNDLILNGVVVLICLAVPFILFFTGRGNEKTAVVSFDGKECYEVSLSENTKLSVNGVEITVSDGCAYVSHSSCPDRLCMKMKKAENNGDSIICVPNKVSVKIIGRPQDGGADIVAG